MIRFSFKVTSITLGILLFATFVLSNSSAFAAKVGERLAAPEAGWTRFDDRSPELLYGDDWVKINDAEDYNKTVLGAVHNKPNVINFKFEGTKIRLIINMSDSYTKKVGISIDGNIEYFTAYRESWSHQRLGYEKLGLERGVHEVKIWTEEPSKNRVVYDYRFDAIDVDSDGKLIDYYAPTKLLAVPGDSQVVLKWDQVSDADSYTLKYGTEPGKYSETIEVTKDVYGNFVVPNLTNGITYYFVVNAKVNGIESEFSNEASATPFGDEQPDPSTPEEPGSENPGTEEPTAPEVPSGDRAILVVTMVNGLEKEYDLPMSEVNSFINWYDKKDAGNGSSKHAINKHDNNIGPFNSRVDYVIFNNILTFEVNAYN
ncbi:fibronectin type III domain-containing protein [Paenibacillus jiagnxiensis]|uniref:fibronectin type III domain-containing protein n=1 Tax=Paenibacillus jiagnxiensis TaxID=3228926 RepID=UPI0033AE17AB